MGGQMAKPRKVVTENQSRNQLTQDKFSQPSSISENKCSSFQGQTVMSRYLCLGVAALAASMALGFSGCCSSGCNTGGGGSLWGFVDSFMQKQVACMQEQVWARRAFHLRYGHCERVHADHFRAGFIAGYCNVCNGDGTEPPALPPEQYWGFQYRNQEGAEMQTAWFSGFESGAHSAQTDGSGSFQNIQISRQLEEAMLAADQLQDVHGGIQREYEVGLAPIVGSGLVEPKQPRANVPYITGPITTSPTIPNSNQGSGSRSIPNSNQGSSSRSIPMSSPVPQPISVPNYQTGAGSNMPIPMQSVPPVPYVPGS